MFEPEVHLIRRSKDNAWSRCRYWWIKVRCGFVFLFFSSSISFAQELKATRPQIQELIRTLDASTLSERTRAERQLLDLGPEILSKLPVIETVESVSVRESLKRIRLQLERRAARDSSGPSRVSLDGEYSLRDIIAEVEKQTGNRLVVVDDDGSLLKQTLNVTWDRSTFWDCLDELCLRVQLQWRFPPESPALELSRPASSMPQSIAVQRSGPFRLVIESVEIRPVVGESRQKLIRLNGRLAMEPRLRPLFLAVAVADLKASADDDQVLPAWNPTAKYELPVQDGGHEVQMSWDFSSTDVESIRILKLVGRVRCQIAAATERIVFDQTSLEAGTIRRRGGVSVRIREVEFMPREPNKMEGSIGVAVSYETGGPAFESHRTWIFHNAVYLETQSGKRVAYTDFDTAQQSDGAVAVDYRWAQIDAPFSQYTFVYEAPTLIIDVPLDINLDRIPAHKR